MPIPTREEVARRGQAKEQETAKRMDAQFKIGCPLFSASMLLAFVFGVFDLRITWWMWLLLIPPWVVGWTYLVRWIRS